MWFLLFRNFGSILVFGETYYDRNCKHNLSDSTYYCLNPLIQFTVGGKKADVFNNKTSHINIPKKLELSTV